MLAKIEGWIKFWTPRNEVDWFCIKVILICLISIIALIIFVAYLSNKQTKENIIEIPQKIQIWSTKENMNVEVLHYNCNFINAECEVKLPTGPILLYCGEEKCRLK
jgi:uncharacterized protein YpmS